MDALTGKYIIFVDGDLRITKNVRVGVGGFLAFIVKGSITIDPAVIALQGIYITDQNFVTETKSPTLDNQLNVSGTVAAWGSFSLNRNLGAAKNFTTPAEKFIYRPDLLLNMPNRMKTFVMEWQEVVPGTYGN